MAIKTEKTIEYFKKYNVPILKIAPVMMFLDVSYIIKRNRQCLGEAEKLAIAYKMLDEYRYTLLRQHKSNNWLKMHKIPMRRKSEKTLKGL